MATRIITCKVQEFLQVSESGEIDQARVLEFVEEIGEMATANPGRNILVDLRETNLTSGSMADIVEASVKAERFKALQEIKIAGVVPDEPIRAVIASRVEGLMQWKSIDYHVFTELDEATAWLEG